MEFTPETTWKQLYEFAAFFKKLRDAGQDVPYGYAQHQGSFAWTTQLDIQRMLFATAGGPSSTSTTSWARRRRGRPTGATSSRS